MPLTDPAENCACTCAVASTPTAPNTLSWLHLYGTEQLPTPWCRSPHPPVEKGVKRLLMCSGKVFYELRAERAKQGKQNDIHIIRLEQVGLVV